MIDINIIEWEWNKNIKPIYRESLKVLIASDQNYLKLCPVMMNSLILNTKKNNIEFYILTANFNYDNVDFYREIFKNVSKNIILNFVLVKDEFINKWSNKHNNNFSREVWYKLLFFREEWKIEKAIYIDIDTVFINELNDEILKGNDWYIKGSQDLYLLNTCDKNELLQINNDIKENDQNFKQIKTYHDYFFKYLKIDMKHYINMGFFVINTDYNKNTTFDIFKNLNDSKYLHFNEQDAINKIFQDKILLIEPYYNFLSCYHEIDNFRNDKNLLSKIIMIHFAGKQKPWSENNFYYNEKFFLLYREWFFKTFKSKRIRKKISKKIVKIINCEFKKLLVFKFISKILKVLFKEKTKVFLKSLIIFMDRN